MPTTLSSTIFKWPGSCDGHRGLDQHRHKDQGERTAIRADERTDQREQNEGPRVIRVSEKEYIAGETLSCRLRQLRRGPE